MSPRHIVRDEDRIAMIVRWGGVCAICGEENGARDLAMDHDHATGALRGTLCTRCNVGLGYFRDDPDLLRRAALYLLHPGLLDRANVEPDPELHTISFSDFIAEEVVG